MQLVRKLTFVVFILSFISNCIATETSEEPMVKWTEFSFILKPSPIADIGIFTTHDIPEGTHVFAREFFPRIMKTKDVPVEFRKYCHFINDEEYLCPERFDRMEIGWFINHSNSPNVSIISGPAGNYYVITTCDIKAGEEILMDYNQLDEPEHLKEPYYHPKN